VLVLPARQAVASSLEEPDHPSSAKDPRRQIAVATLLFCMPPLTWTATGLLAGWLAARRGKSWRWGFALGFFCSTAGVVLAALPRGSRDAL
jgi:hypothetical protein